jgi:catechol 2,3-dioxygenase-like lactoylglutathione lyase family enzyme
MLYQSTCYDFPSWTKAWESTSNGGEMSTTTSRISQIQLVMIPSTDQDRSVAFYEALGFERRNDIPFGDSYRWVEVYTPSGTTGIALVSPRPGDPMAVQTGVILNTDNIDATHAHLQSSGVDVDAEVARVGAPTEIRIGAVELVGPVPPMFYFRDPDDNTLLMVEVN